MSLPMVVTDSDDPDRQNRIKWGCAIQNWQEGYKLLLRPLLADTSIPIPDFAREFLADLAEESVIKDDGRPTERSGELERKIVADVFRAWDGSTKERACFYVADRHALTPDAVRGLLERFIRLGITRKAWISWGRPNW